MGGRIQALGSHERDVPSSEMVRQHSTEVMQAGFTSTVSECFERGNPETVNASNVDDSRRIIGRACFLKQGCQKAREIEDSVEIQGEHSGPSGGRILVVRSSPVGSGIVDENMKLC